VLRPIDALKAGFSAIIESRIMSTRDERIQIAARAANRSDVSDRKLLIEIVNDRVGPCAKIDESGNPVQRCLARRKSTRLGASQI
jgi:hypothetical protein